MKYHRACNGTKGTSTHKKLNREKLISNAISFVLKQKAQEVTKHKQIFLDSSFMSENSTEPSLHFLETRDFHHLPFPFENVRILG